ncbi:helix-turn-helix transcriptional regulator [Streptomyces cucumeris]|uniref:helix-turn-helix transcriptional regulator n=1 Tax=Streptomyces cucumeris TaxID=2962890 RepID=UPI003D7445CC
MGVNAVLRDRIEDRGLTQAELAHRMNTAIERLTGRLGTVSERTVHNLVSGRTRWPQARIRAALRDVFGSPAEELGFTPPGVTRRPPQTEKPVRRRHFVTTTTGSALFAMAPLVAPSTVGVADVQRLRNRLASMWLMDDRKGGGPDLESHAVQHADYALDLLQNGSATQRVRGRLYALAASFTAGAMWTAVDSGQLARAERHLEKAITLAGLSGDGQVQHQTWRYAAMLADQRGRPADSIAAAEAAMSTAAHRRDPLYASLSHARLALAASTERDTHRARRAVDRAAEAFSHADPDRPRPASMDFYTRGELDGLTAITLLRLGHPARSECHTHRCLAALRPDQHRNRAYYNLHLALAQLRQGEVEQACATAGMVNMTPGAAGGRTGRLLETFTAALNSLAPDAAVTRDWNDRPPNAAPVPQEDV